MKFHDLRAFIDEVERLGELKRVEGAHWDCEIGAVTELMAEHPSKFMLLFDRIKGYPPGYRVATNILTTVRRTALVLGLPPDLKGIELLKAWRRKYKGLKPIPPVEVNVAPVKQNVYTGGDVDLSVFPTPRWHQFDGGRYLGTSDAVITRDPDEGWVNVGTYRCMIQGKNKISVKINEGKHARMMMQKYHARGQACPIAISFGHDPALFMASSEMNIPWGFSEYDYAGWIREEPIQVTKGEVTHLPIPATAEIVIEGEIPPDFESLQEGPFGEWPGYLADSTKGMVPVVTVKSILHRDDPIILGAPPLKPPAPYRSALNTNAIGIWEEMEKVGIVGVMGVWIPIFDMPYIVFVAIKQMYAGHANQAATAAASCRSSMLGGRFICVVDDDVDITNIDDVLWAVATRCDADTINIIKGLPTSFADPLLTEGQRMREDASASRILINACRPYTRRKDFARINIFEPEYREEIRSKWRELFAE